MNVKCEVTPEHDPGEPTETENLIRPNIQKRRNVIQGYGGEKNEKESRRKSNEH